MSQDISTAEIIERASRRFRDRDEIVAAGFVPGWHGEPVKVGDTAVMYGHGQWREVIVTKVTGTLAHGVFTTPGAINEALRIQTSYLGIDPERVGASAAKQAAKNWDWASYVAQGQPGDPWYRGEAPRSQYSPRLSEGVIADEQRWIAQHPDRVAHIEAERAEEQASAEAKIAEAKGGWHQWVNTTNASGRRDGRKTDLYVRS